MHHKKIILPILMASMFMNGLLMNGVVVILGSISTSMNLDAAQLALTPWVLTAYMLGNTMTMPLFGKITDIYGRRKTFIACLAAFVTLTFACGLTDSIYALITMRFLSGLAGGGFQPAIYAIIADIYDHNNRAGALGTFQMGLFFAQAIGPVFAGIILKYLSWHWFFFAVVPFGAAGVLLSLVYLKETMPSHTRPVGRFDYMGLSLITSGLFALVYGFTNLNHTTVYAYTTGGILLLAAILLTLFFRYEHRAQSPIIHPKLLKNRNILFANAVQLIDSIVLLWAFTFLVALLQKRFYLSNLGSSAFFIPYSISLAISAPIFGKIADKAGTKPVILGGTLLFSAGMFGIAAADTIPLFALSIMGLGAAFGMIGSALGAFVVNSVPPHHTGIATSMYGISRTVGMAVGPVAGGIFVSITSDAAAFTHSYTIAAILSLLAVVFALGLGADKKYTDREDAI